MKKSLLAAAALMTLFLTACGETKKEPTASAPASEASATAASTPVEASTPVAASTPVEASAPVAASTPVAASAASH